MTPTTEAVNLHQPDRRLPAKFHRLKLFLIGLIMLVPACSTIDFVQYEQASPSTPDSYWHHTLINGMVEVSKPLNLGKICKGKAWTKLTMERSAWNILIGLPIPSYDFLLPYIAWTNRVYCFQTPETETETASS